MAVGDDDHAHIFGHVYNFENEVRTQGDGPKGCKTLRLRRIWVIPIAAGEIYNRVSGIVGFQDPCFYREDFEQNSDVFTDTSSPSSISLIAFSSGWNHGDGKSSPHPDSRPCGDRALIQHCGGSDRRSHRSKSVPALPVFNDVAAAEISPESARQAFQRFPAIRVRGQFAEEQARARRIVWTL